MFATVFSIDAQLGGTAHCDWVSATRVVLVDFVTPLDCMIWSRV